MKKNKQLVQSFSIIGMVLILSLGGGCKKELSKDSAKLNNADLLMSKEAGLGKKKVLRQSPGLKIEVKGETIKRISPILKSIDKITSILNEEQGKNKSGGAITTSDVSFTASLAGYYYNCNAEINQDDGPHDWYLINWNTGVYTYIGSTSDNYINFNVNKPSMYGNYRVWAEGPNGAGFTGYQYMGDPYTGVTMVGGLLEFNDAASLENLINRLENAYEVHSSNFIDPLDYLSDDAITNYAQAVGFDEFLPFKEFEAFFGLYSLRQRIESEEIAWLNTADPWSASVYPDDNYAIEDDAERSVNNQFGQLRVSGVLIEPISYIEGPTIEVEYPCSAESWLCTEKKKIANNINLPDNKMIRWKVTKKRGGAESGGNMWFDSSFKGKIRKFRKQNGIWKKQMAKMSVRIFGKAYRHDGYSTCIPANLVDTFDETTSYKRKYMRKERDHWNQYTWVKSCEVGATFNVNGYIFTKYLK